MMQFKTALFNTASTALATKAPPITPPWYARSVPQERAWVYARSLSEDMARLMNQTTALLKEADRRKLAVIGHSQELAAPHQLYRPALFKMLCAAHKNQFDTLVITDLSRLSFQPWKLRLILRHLRRHHIRLLTTEADLRYDLYRAGLGGLSMNGR